jgi:hypothetical protein
MKFFTIRLTPSGSVGVVNINPQYIVSIQPGGLADNNIGSKIRVYGDESAIYDDYRKPEELLELLSSYHHQSSFLSL